MTSTLAPLEKALAVNTDRSSYGTFAEIGAGQEVARWFFRAGRASATVAKTMSAYDMTFSDAIYGSEQHRRYVCESRVGSMLDHEYDLLIERLGDSRGADTRFFAFADTVASRRADSVNGGHGWLGVRFQHEPGAAPSDAVIHIRLLDRRTLEQQEAVGRLGLNLVYACQFLAHDPASMIRSLRDNLDEHQFEVDMIRLRGPVFEGVDNRVLSLHLVREGLADAVLFAPDGRVLQPADEFFGKDVLVQRGRFRPLTQLHVDMFERARAQFVAARPDCDNCVLSLMELTTNNLVVGGDVDVEDFMARVDTIGSLGHHVVVSNYAETYRLSEFVMKYTRGRVGLVMGIGHLAQIYDARYYEDLQGGLLAALGCLFHERVTALIYPAYSLDVQTPCPEGAEVRELTTAANYSAGPEVQHLHQHLLATGSVCDIDGVDESLLTINSENVLAAVREGRPEWAEHIPAPVAALIQERGLFGLSSEARRSASAA